MKMKIKIFGYRLQDILNPFKWKMILIAWVLKREDITLEYCEQVVYRSLMCKPCVAKGKCLHCTCAIPASMMPRENMCSESNWGPMMDTDTWKEYKKVYAIDIKL